MRRALHDHFGRVLVAAGWLCIGLSTICGFGFAAGTTLPPGGDLISLVAMIVFVLTGQRLIRHGKKIRSATADAVLETDPRRPIVYLRSFRDDEIAAKFAPQPKVATEEEMLTTVLAEIGPVIAIGRPGEPSPQIGAARFYVEDDRWQRRVNELVCTAQLVVARAGDTQGLRWELEQVVQQVPPTRFLLIVPFHAVSSAIPRVVKTTRITARFIFGSLQNGASELLGVAGASAIDASVERSTPVVLDHSAIVLTDT